MKSFEIKKPALFVYIHVVDLFMCHCIYLCIMNVYMLVY